MSSDFSRLGQCLYQQRVSVGHRVQVCAGSFTEAQRSAEPGLWRGQVWYSLQIPSSVCSSWFCVPTRSVRSAHQFLWVLCKTRLKLSEDRPQIEIWLKSMLFFIDLYNAVLITAAEEAETWKLAKSLNMLCIDACTVYNEQIGFWWYADIVQTKFPIPISADTNVSLIFYFCVLFCQIPTIQDSGWGLS